MVRSITLGLVAFGTAATLAAQAPAPPSPSPERQAPSVDQPAPRTQTQAPTPPSASASSANKVTYTGCLKPGAAPGTWVLESAALSPAGASSADRPVGTSGMSSEAFLLTAKPSDNLKPHANHKIEVTGVVGAASTTSSTTSTTTTAAPAPGAPTESKTTSSTASTTTVPRQAITIDSFKMVSASCP